MRFFLPQRLSGFVEGLKDLKTSAYISRMFRIVYMYMQNSFALVIFRIIYFSKRLKLGLHQ